MIFLLGKHQFTVSSIDDSSELSIISPATPRRKSGGLSPEMLSLVENFEKLITGISRDAHSSEDRAQEGDISARYFSLIKIPIYKEFFGMKLVMLIIIVFF